ncbi:bifunctional riboflavin kinase/FAD synthetase [Marinilabilia rubra]|uniref:Riboflavin biosynthesis protein n=1 Tax=Marinilabilia rubra TaxID=2162893 RepID=A0A2U2BD37_9BACT|nr:bifunctional riboflavin kinase/FAD synthetase [Marinilabilia rubra]PWE00971.1 bifunctional riboflavin kinase/FMN adenylyltransferase [Marinilabilia rubra]
MKIKSSIEGLKASRPVLTMGMFDGVHKGHVSLLSQLVEKAKEVNGESVVLTFWPHPRLVLRQDSGQLRFLTTLEEKTKLISEIGVDQLVILPFTREFAGLSASRFIREYLIDKIRVNHLLVGYNHRFGHDGISRDKLNELAQNYGFGLDFFGPVNVLGMNPSSTAIRNYISDGDVWEASRLLGRFYGLQGRIVSGRRLGREIGFPTANIEMDDPLKLVPHDGVYACKVHLLGKTFGGMINIGGRPTIEGETGHRSLEVHIFYFNKEVYSEEITVEFIKRTRPEIKFPSLEALKERLSLDEREVKDILKKEGVI